MTSQPPQPPAIELSCGCIRGEYVCERAQTLWARYMDAQRIATKVEGPDNAWNRYWQHYGASEMYR